MKKRGDIELDSLAYWLIAIFLLVIIVAIIIYLKSKGISALDYIKNLLKFGR